MLQKPYLSRYEFNLQNYKINSDFTVKTKAGGESSDDDEYHLECTSLTERMENSDEDELNPDTTITTETMETSDPDEYYLFGTTITRTSEDSDSDFFLVHKDN